MVLEVATGRKPIISVEDESASSNVRLLADWVWDLYRDDVLLDAADIMYSLHVIPSRSDNAEGGDMTAFASAARSVSLVRTRLTVLIAILYGLRIVVVKVIGEAVDDLGRSSSFRLISASGRLHYSVPAATSSIAVKFYPHFAERDERGVRRKACD
ncbi:unnamed protein product [Calypogeia fissa]